MNKQSIITILLTVLMSIVGINAFAHDIEVKNSDGVTIYYKWTNNNTELAVSYRGSYGSYYNNEYTGNVVIPKSVAYNGNTYPVTSISDWAFEQCRGLTAITIPNSVTSIGDHAFFDCDGLTSITIPNSVISIGVSTFNCCRGLTSVTIPNSVTSIGGGAFHNCENLTSVTISNSVIFIGEYAFCDCSSLTSIMVEGGNKNYDSRNNCNAIIEKSSNSLIFGCKNTTIPNSVTSIGGSAFRSCRGLTSVTIPNSVTSIGEYAFEKCSGLTSVIFPNSVTSIGVSAFNGCSGLTSVTIPNSVTSIGESAFYGCSGLTSVTIPNSVTSIGVSTFNGCSGLTSVTIPNSVTSIGGSAFRSCSGATSVIIPNSVTSIGNSAFYGCSGLTSVTIPNSVTSIGGSAFEGCSGLTSIIVEGGNKNYDSRNNCNAIIKKSSNSLIAGCKNTTIPNSVTSVGEYAFVNCSGLTSITIPNSVTSIGVSAFAGCSGLTSVIIPNSVTSIGNSAFYNCSGLTSVTIPISVTSIGNSAFYNCSGLTSVTIPNSVTSIGEYAFYGCSGLKTIYSELGTPIQITYSEYNKYEGDYIYVYPFSNDIFTNTILYVPQDTKSNYLAMAGWNKFTNIFEVGEVGSIFEVDGIYYKIGKNNTVSVISGSTKYSGNVVIPNQVSFWETTYSVTSISNSAFNGCSSLTSIIILSNMIEFPWGTFMGCENLKEMILSQTAYENGIPASVTKFTTYSKNPMQVVVTSKGAISATVNIYPIDDRGNTNEDNCYTVTMQGLMPGQYIKWKLDDENYGIISEKTADLTLTTQPAQPTSTTKARLIAIVNEVDDDQHYGFEWLRYGAPESMPPNKVYAPLYNGQIMGSLSGLNPDIYYNYRPFYKSDSGEMVYGEWITFLTGDANVFFEPETHTKEASEVTDASAQLAGVWVEGTENIEEKGFEYWTVSIASTRAAGSDAKTVAVSGNQTTITIDDLEGGKEYGYRTYVKTASGTTYGEEKTFKTVLMGDVNNDGDLNEVDVDDVASYIMGQSPTGFSKKKADMNGDEIIDVVDIVMIQNNINKK